MHAQVGSVARTKTVYFSRSNRNEPRAGMSAESFFSDRDLVDRVRAYVKVEELPLRTPLFIYAALV